MSSAMLPGPNRAFYPINYNQREFPPNAFNRCLEEETAFWAKIQRCGGLATLCPGHDYPIPPWVKMPGEGKRFGHPSSIPLASAVLGVDTIVQSFIVPYGYDGVIVATTNRYTGQGFVEGSGDLIWRIRLNQHYVNDYGNIITQLGSLTQPYYNANSQIFVQSGQLVQYLVNRSLGSLGNLNGGRIICALNGWYWPR
jgi:hypothetical protein